LFPSKIWAVYFEYRQADLCGLLPEIRCCVFADLNSGKTERFWFDKLGTKPPIDLSDKILLAHNWAAEYACFKALGWPDPAFPIDTMQETDRLRIVAGRGYRPTSLKNLLHTEKLPAIEEKENMRFLAMEERLNGKYTDQEKKDLLDYCEKDTMALLLLWPAIKKRILSMMPDEESAFYWAFQRAKYVFCCNDMDLAGIPIDRELFYLLKKREPQIHAGLHKKLAGQYGCSDGVTHFKIKGLQEFISNNNLVWPRTRTGLPKTDGDTLKRIKHEYPIMRDFVEIFKTLKKAKIGNLNVYADRCYSKVWPFAQSGSRNSVKKNGIFGAARWMRGLIKPPPGKGMAYLDFGREEILIQAVLAKCPSYLEAYYSDDVHTVNGKNFGLIHDEMPKDDFKAARHLAKTAGFMIQYGGSAFGLSQSLGVLNGEAEGIIRAYQRNYPEIKQWRLRVESAAIAKRYLLSPDGSVLRFRENFNTRAACNFPIQATGAAILRWAQIRLREHGVKMLAPIHDAILFEYPLDCGQQILDLCKREMIAAGKLFLDDYELLVDVEAEVNFPNNFPPGDQKIWDMIMELAGAG
jgi:DNA polymerase-1